MRNCGLEEEHRAGIKILERNNISDTSGREVYTRGKEVELQPAESSISYSLCCRKDSVSWLVLTCLLSHLVMTYHSIPPIRTASSVLPWPLDKLNGGVCDNSRRNVTKASKCLVFPKQSPNLDDFAVSIARAGELSNHDCHAGCRPLFISGLLKISLLIWVSLTRHGPFTKNKMT